MELTPLSAAGTEKVKEAFWGLSDIFRLAGLYLAVLIPATFAFMRFDTLSPILAKIVALTVVMMVHYKFRFWPGVEYFAMEWRDFRAHLKSGVLWGLAAKIIPIIMALLLVVPLVAIVGDALPELQLEANHETGSLTPFSLPWILTVFGLIILAPLIEELFIRGILHGYVRGKWGVRAGILVSSLVFALLHGIGFILLPTFVAGIAFAMLYERTGSLASCMIAHSVFNLVAVVASSVLVL
jgi:membrane protease YdiL (CAAX protease family)